MPLEPEGNAILISVIVPTYARPRPLRACLRALATQTLNEAWEVIVVDDGSPEPIDAGELTRSGILLPGWRVIRQPNAGPAAARNRGVETAHSRLVAFTDDDCCPEPTWLETLLQEARRRPDALIGGTTVNGISGDLFAGTSQLIVDWVYAHFNRDPGNAYFLASNNILCAREQFQAICGFDAGFRQASEDRDFCDRWRMAGWPIVWCQQARISHRHPQSWLQFLSLHFRYGQGAFAYHACRRRRRSGRLLAEMGFHRSLPRMIRRHLVQCHGPARGARLIAALTGWQLANAVGFVMAAVTSRARAEQH